MVEALPALQPLGPLMSCWFCSQEMRSGPMSVHLQTTHRKKVATFFCEICVQPFKTKTDFLLHNLNDFCPRLDDDKPYQCNACDCAFAGFKNLEAGR